MFVEIFHHMENKNFAAVCTPQFTRRKMKIAQFAALCLINGLLGLLPIAAAAQPYTISADGSEVTDQKTGLIWRRCAEGMTYSGGTCTGTARIYTREAALQQAAAQATSTGVAWRLPNIKELTSIANRTLNNPAIDSTAFPATPSDYFWSSSFNEDDHSYGWSIYFGNGSPLDGVIGGSGYYVRLVRAGQ